MIFLLSIVTTSLTITSKTLSNLASFFIKNRHKTVSEKVSHTFKMHNARHIVSKTSPGPQKAMP